MKTKLIIMLLFMTPIMANFNFGECSWSGSFEQQIVHYSGDYENIVVVGVIPAGIEGLRVELQSDKDVDIRLYGSNEDKIVHWPYGLLSKSYAQTALYEDTNVSYSGYNGTDGQKGHEFIEVDGSTPTTMIMKAFGYQSGYATVNYSWTGKVDCTPDDNGTGNFTQKIEENATTLVGTIPTHVKNLEINLTSENDIDIQLYGADGTAIVSWKPKGLLFGEGKQSFIYHNMTIEWSGYNGVDGQTGDEYIKVSPVTDEQLTMKVFGYKSGTANVTYSWGNSDTSVSDRVAPIITLLGASSVTVIEGEEYIDIGVTAIDNIDGNITSNVIVNNLVDTTVIGTYTVTYDVNDSAGNSAVQISRVVNVVKKDIVPIGKELIHGGGNTLGVIDKNNHWSTYGQTYGVQSRTYNSKNFLYSTNKGELGAGMYQEFSTEIGREYEVNAILVGTDTNRKEEWNGETYITISDNSPTVTASNVMVESVHVSGGLETAISFKFIAKSISSYLAIRSSGIWLYANARAISVKAMDNELIDDKTPPQITLLGQSEVIVYQGKSYIDAGANANDNIDGDISTNILIDNPVNTALIGTYTITYDVNDSAGNSATTITRTVTVTDTVSQKPENGTIHIIGSAVDYVSLQSAIDNAVEGDTIELGDGIYYEQINVEKDNLTIRAAEGEANVVISGEKKVSNWQYDSSKELYYASSPCAEVNSLFINHKKAKASRYPENGDYITVASVQEVKSKFTLKNINENNGYFNGANAHIRLNHWRLDTQRVQSYVNSQVSLKNFIGSYSINTNYKVFFTHVLSTVNEENEWAYNNGTIYLKSSTPPENITTSCSEFGIHLKTSVKSVDISGLNITKTKGNGIVNTVRDCDVDDNIRIHDNNISHAEEWGINLHLKCENKGKGVQIKNNEIAFTTTGGILAYTIYKLSVSDNYIHDVMTSKLDGDVTAKGTYSMGTGICLLNCEGAHIHHNVLKRIGYNGICIINYNKYGGNRIIEKNYIEDAMIGLNDGACIYTHIALKKQHNVSDKDYIRGNIVKNCKGSYKGAVQWPVHQGAGLYLDDSSSLVDMTNNTVIGSYMGVYFHNSEYINLMNNTIVASINKSLYMNTHISGLDANSISILNNQFLEGRNLNGTSINEVYYIRNNNTTNYIKESNHNTIRANMDKVFSYNVGTMNRYTKPEWFNTFGQDADSTVIVDNTQPVILLNITKNPKIFYHLEGCKNSDKSIFDNTLLSLEPYESRVFFGCSHYSTATYEKSK